MRAAVRLPVTVKMRIGVVSGTRAEPRAALLGFDEDEFAALHGFVARLREAGCEAVIVHARKAVLGGLSPKDNRQVPPLRYDVVRRLKSSFPELPVIVNGGLRDVPSVLAAWQWCEGVMLGREAYHRPILLRQLERALTPALEPLPAAAELLERMARYAERELARGERLPSITRHMLGLHAGEPGAREYRRLLSEGARARDAGPELIRRAAKFGAAGCAHGSAEGEPGGSEPAAAR
jgi:tRNA-dihydrouridine synthase A